MQPGGAWYLRAGLPGFLDRRGQWRSALASTALRLLAERVGVEYLVARPPVYLNEPYEARWLMSYCDTRRHHGTIYRAAGLEPYRRNDAGIVTWRAPLPPLTPAQRAAIEERSRQDARARRFRATRAYTRAQLALV